MAEEKWRQIPAAVTLSDETRKAIWAIMRTMVVCDFPGFATMTEIVLSNLIEDEHERRLLSQHRPRRPS